MDKKTCKGCGKELDVCKFNAIKRVYPAFSSKCEPRHYLWIEPNCKECIKEKNRKKSKRYYLKNRLEITRSARRKYKTQKYKKYARNYARNKRKTDLHYRIKDNISRRIRDALRKSRKSKRTLELLGCSPRELRDYLTSKFQNGMSWDNYGEWHIDHIRPCASFNLTKPKEQEKCFHYSNLQPLWARDNLSKKDDYSVM
jgi:hypothetical protein